MAKTRTGKVATGLTLAGFFFVLIAFFTPNWLVTDGKLAKPKFEKIGLWVVCFNGLTDVRHWYETEFCSCWWVFEEEFYIIHDLLLPGFFIATQFFFTVCFALLLFSTICILFYLCSSRHNDHFITLLTILGSCVSAAAASGTLALIIFGYNGDGRVWMPNWEHNDIGYSYALGVIGVICSFIAGALYLIEARRFKIKRRSNLRGEPAYHMESRKSSHTPI